MEAVVIRQTRLAPNKETQLPAAVRIAHNNFSTSCESVSLVFYAMANLCLRLNGFAYVAKTDVKK